MRKTIKRKIALAGAILIGITMSACNTDSSKGVVSSSSPTSTAAPEAKSTSTVSAAEKTVSAEKIEVTYKEEELNTTWKDSEYTKITGTADSITVDGSGVKESERIITITAAGTYVFSGNFSNSQVVVDAGKEDVVKIVLNGANISCTNSSAINGVQSKKIILTLEEGTKNQLEDGSAYENLDSSEEPSAAFFSKDDIVINGTGTLTVKGNYNNGIQSKDDIRIISGNLQVTAANDGIKGKDSIIVRDGTIDIVSGGDGMQSNNDSDTAKGYIVLEGGDYTINSSQDGIQAETVLQIDGGQYDINTGEKSTSADAKANSTQSGDMWERGKPQEMPEGTAPSGVPSGNFPNGTPPSNEEGNSTVQNKTVPNIAETTSNTDSNSTTDKITEATEETEPSVSQKALKGGSAVYISEGTINVDSFDDSVHSNGNVTISGGTLTLSSGDDAVHADADLLVEEGTITIVRSYEGLEGNTVTITGGSTHLTSTDDGVNASGGTSSLNGAPSMDSSSVSADTYIRISGGYLYVDAQGDGLDSNGMIYIDGGTTIVNGPTSGGDGALDFDGTGEITGGILIAAGSSQMAQAPSDSSTQTSLFVSYQSTQAEGTLVNLLDENGNTVFRFAPAKEYSSIVISMPSLVSGKTYTLTSGGSVTDTNASPVDGYYTDGKNTTGTKLTDVTLADMVTKISDDGTAVTTNGMGGGGIGRRGGGGMGRMQQDKTTKN